MQAPHAKVSLQPGEDRHLVKEKLAHVQQTVQVEWHRLDKAAAAEQGEAEY